MVRDKYAWLLPAMAGVFLLLAAVSCAQDSRRPDADQAQAHHEVENGRPAGDRREPPPFDDQADRPRPPGRGPVDGPRQPPPDGASRPPRDFDRPPFNPNRPPPSGFSRPGQQGEPGAPPRPIPGPPASMEKYDPELYKLLQEDQELERQTADLAIRWRRAPQEERTALKQELTENVGKHFEVRQERRRIQLKRLEEELQSLREAIEKRDEAREEVIQHRVSELLGQEDDLGF